MRRTQAQEYVAKAEIELQKISDDIHEYEPDQNVRLGRAHEEPQGS